MATDAHDRPGAAFWASAAIGAAIVAFGVRGLLVEEPRGAASAGRWLVGGALVVDLLVIPVGAALAAIARRVVPPAAWPTAVAGLFASAVLVIVAAPLVLDLGGVPANPTIRPRAYGSGLLAALAAVWCVAGAIGLVRHRREGRGRPAPPSAAGA